MRRCAWATTETLIQYHDLEWGVPQHDDRILFEFLILEGAQAGLSWEIVLKRRTAYRQAFANFDPSRVARFDVRRQEALLSNDGLIRNRAKIQSTIRNAKAFIAIQSEFGTFDSYLWRFVDGNSIRRIGSHRITRSSVSDMLSKDLLSRDFSFVGPTICYAYMQAIGMVNDHERGCFRHKQLR